MQSARRLWQIRDMGDNRQNPGEGKILYAKRRERKNIGGHWVEVKPRCTDKDSGYSFCVSHQKVCISPEDYTAHTTSKGVHLMVWICTPHGPEEHFRKGTAATGRTPKPPTIGRIACPGCGAEEFPTAERALTQTDVDNFTVMHRSCKEPSPEYRACSNCNAPPTERTAIPQEDGAAATRCKRCGLVERGLSAAPQPQANA